MTTNTATICKAESNHDAAWYNFGRSSIPLYRSPKCAGAGWDLRLANGDRVAWYLTKKQAQDDARALGLQIVK